MGLQNLADRTRRDVFGHAADPVTTLPLVTHLRVDLLLLGSLA